MTTLDPTAEREKKLVALSSVIAAVFLTGMKIVVGLLTNSLGILSEAAHSGLDLVAAVMTLLAVRVSDRPPDPDHPYGHGKIENLSALGETFLLFATCIWVVYEAIHRLVEPVIVEASIWSFAVMGTSIIVDFTRSRALMRMAKKHSSQALEADALHFSTDIWSSAVVILGLVGVWIAQSLHERADVHADWLFKADAVAALGVSAIVIYVSYRLGRRTVDALMDRASRELMDRIGEATKSLPGVLAVKRVRLRQSGPATFVDMTIDVPRSASLEEAHSIATAAETAVERLLPRADVLVHVDPGVQDEQSLVERVFSAAARHGFVAHGLRAYDVRGKLSLSMHVEVPETMTLGEAHERVTTFEDELRREIPTLKDVVTHMEPLGDKEVHRDAVQTKASEVRQVLKEIRPKVPGIQDCHSIHMYREGGELAISFHCLVDPGVSIADAHRLTVDLEALLRARLREIGRVVIHVEPLEGREKPPA